MKRNKILIIILAFCLIAAGGINSAVRLMHSAANNIITSINTVVIDAGHGGRDAGTIGVDGTQEKKINLEIALALYDFLRVSGVNAVLIRSTDAEYYPEGSDKSRSDLYNRIDFVNSVKSSVLISIHQNHFEDEKEWGTQIWYSPNDDKSRVLADSILERIKTNLQPDNKRENKPSDNSYYILYKATVPSIMVECGFMSNNNENAKLKETVYQNNIAYSILTGICDKV